MRKVNSLFVWNIRIVKEGKNEPPLTRRPKDYLSNDLMNGFKSADNLLLRKAYSMKVST